MSDQVPREPQAERAATVGLISRLRWAAVALSVAMVLLTRPAPLSPSSLLALSLLTLAYNVPAALAGRLARGPLEALVVVSLIGDFVLCAAWVLLTGNDPGTANYVVFMVVAVEAAVLYRWKGTLAFIAAVLVTFGALFWERVALHVANVLPSYLFRASIVVIMAWVSAALTQETHRRRGAAARALRAAEAAAAEAKWQSERSDALSRVAARIGASLSRDAVLETVMDSLAEIFPRRWHGFLVDDGEEGVRLAHVRGEPRELELPLPLRLRSTTANQLYVFDDIWHSPELRAAGFPLPSSLCGYSSAAALVLGGRRFSGILLSLDSAPAAFGDGEVTFLEAIGHQLATALDNARLYAEMEVLSLTDTLTGLLNRRAFDLRVGEELIRAQRYEMPFAILVLDVDHFKDYNDTHGHSAGDEVLRRLAEVIGNSVLRESDLAFRHGGEEFAVIMPSTTASQALAVAKRLCQRVGAERFPHSSGQRAARLTVSVGVAAFPEHATAAVDLVERADLALYAAKAGGRDRARIFTPLLVETTRHWSHVVQELVDSHSVDIVYQVIRRLDDGRVAGYEALARPPGGAAEMSVDGMFSAARRLGLLLDLDKICRDAAIAGAARRQQGTPLFINISVGALLDPQTDVQAMALLAGARCPRGGLVLEISEREPVADLAHLQRVLARYREHGFRFALDDVGDGHATLEVLAAADPEYIKIGHRLVGDAASGGARNAIRALVEFARSSGAAVIAEGIVDSEVKELHELGVELGQGFILGRPLRMLGGASWRAAGDLGVDERAPLVALAADAAAPVGPPRRRAAPRRSTASWRAITGPAPSVRPTHVRRGRRPQVDPGGE